MKIRLSIVFYTLLFGSFLSMGQVRIKMQKESGVYKIPCVVNGLKLKFIFDTGASNVCISLSEANLMLENGYLDKKDIIGKGKAQIADGSIINNTRIILREIKINGLILKDVKAVVIEKLKAPLLLGQSAIEKLGKIQIEGDEIIVLNARGNNYSQAEIDEMFNQATSLYNDKMYAAASDTFHKLYDIKELSIYGILKLANSYYYSHNYSKALNYYLEIQNEMVEIQNDLSGDVKEEINDYNYTILSNIGFSYFYLKDYQQAELYIQKSKQYAKTDFQKYIFYSALVDIYFANKDCYLMKNNLYLTLEYLAKYKGYLSDDIPSGKAKDIDIYRKLYLYAFNLIDCGDTKEGGGMMICSAKYGFESAIDYCEDHNLNYKSINKVFVE